MSIYDDSPERFNPGAFDDFLRSHDPLMKTSTETALDICLNRMNLNHVSLADKSKTFEVQVLSR